MDNKTKRILSISEAAQYLCVSRGVIKNWMEKGILPYEEFPGSGPKDRFFRRIRKRDLEEFRNRSYHKQKSISNNISKDRIVLLPRKS